ncbi:MAG: hypothetical protein AAF827_07270 [Cyanobacteria bacterium P01_D01_bin.6]
MKSLRHPGKDFKLYLRQNAPISSKRKVPLELELHSVFSDAMTYFLCGLTGSSGFVRLGLSSEVTKQDRKKTLIRWESGVSEQDYLDKQHLDEIESFFQEYCYDQIRSHGRAR